MSCQSRSGVGRFESHNTMSTTDSTLEPLAPSEAEGLYYESRADELAEKTMRSQKHHVGQFFDWLAEGDIDDMNEVTARTVHRFRLAIKDSIKHNTLALRLGTVRQFLQFCASIDAVHPEVPERVEVPQRESVSRDETLEADRAEEILSYLRKYAYASLTHALTALCWHTAIRTGTLRALDLSDFEPKEQRL